MGTRPEAIKVLPVYLELKKQPEVEAILLSTGQHKEMLNQIFSFFQLLPDKELSLMRPNQGLAQITALLYEHLDSFMQLTKPDLVLVQGDTTTAMVASMVAYYSRIKVGHIEAGLRSYNKFAPFPEEINRKIISQVADIHFAPTQTAATNLEKEGAIDVHMVGNTVIDSLLLAKARIDLTIQQYERKFSSILSTNQKLILLTAHRRENFGEGLQNICMAVKQLAQVNRDCVFVFPVHLNPNIQEAVKTILSGHENVHLLTPLQYDDMIFLLSRSYMVLTDSGGIQEEAPSFDVPIVVLRDVTERPEGVHAGCALIGGTKVEQIVEAFNSIYSDQDLYQKMKKAPNPYGDGNTAKRVKEIICKWDK